MNENAPRAADRQLLIKIIGSYLRHHAVGPGELSSLITSVHRSLSGTGKTAVPAKASKPAVPIKRSVQSDYVVCLECGFRGRSLRRHIHFMHRLDPEAYRRRWKLPPDHPITAPSYSTMRSAIARAAGLGRRRRRAPEIAPEPTPPPTTTADLDPVFLASLSAPRPGRRPRSPARS